MTLGMINLTSSVLEEIKEGHKSDLGLIKVKKWISELMRMEL